MASERILVVDDEPGVRQALKGILGDEGFEVRAVESGEQGLKALEEQPFDAVLLDIWLPGIDGLETLARLRQRRVDAEVVMISGHGTIETAVKATRQGAFDFVEKPLSLEKTLLVVRNALRQRRLERRNRRLLEQLARDTEVLGASAAAAAVRSRISAAAASEAPVLLLGEPGTGRETIARRIHATGSRSGGAFVTLPCRAHVGDAAGQALFGDGGSGGRLALAAHGTLLLSDPEALDPELQARLAAAFAGADEATPDVRMIASTAADPGRLQDDLRRHVDVLRVEVPPLRERREDVMGLFERFMRDLAREYGREQKSLSPQAGRALKVHHWPGNVQELHNLVERLVLMVPGDTVTLEDLPAEMGGAEAPAEDLYREFRSLGEGLESFERYYVRRMLTEERWDVEGAARRLGLPAGDLRNRLDALGLTPPPGSRGG